MQKHDRPPIIGGTSLLTIFAVLCLIVFTLLTISTSIASRNLADRSHQAVQAYYTADSQAEIIFAQLRSGIVAEHVTVDGNTYAYTYPISDTQFLSVLLTESDGNWNVLRWEVVSTLQ